jgi:hypothetical protein
MRAARLLRIRLAEPVPGRAGDPGPGSERGADGATLLLGRKANLLHLSGHGELLRKVDWERSVRRLTIQRREPTRDLVIRWVHTRSSPHKGPGRRPPLRRVDTISRWLG